jgi:hypothetical protein
MEFARICCRRNGFELFFVLFLLLYLQHQTANTKRYTYIGVGMHLNKAQMSASSDPYISSEPKPVIDTSYVFVVFSLPLVDPMVEYTGRPKRFSYYDLNEPRVQYFHFSDRLINGNNHTLSVSLKLRNL